MPLYEYKCLKCGKISEHLVFNEDRFTPYCRWCGSKDVEKVVSRVRVRVSLERRLEKFMDESSTFFFLMAFRYFLTSFIADAAHVAFAETVGAEFISCDEKLVKKMQKI